MDNRCYLQRDLDSYLQTTEQIYIMEAGILRNNLEFASGENYEIYYDFENEEYPQLIKEYGIDKIAGDGTEFEKALRLMDTYAPRLYHQSYYDNSIEMNALSLLAYSLDNRSQGINCRNKAQILNEMCLALGIYARKVWIMPNSGYDNDCHVVNEIWDPQLNKWIMLDITNNEYWVDENGTPLSVLEIRYKGAMQEFCTPIQPGDKMDRLEELKEKYIADYLYIMKNMTYMQYCDYYTVGEDEVKLMRIRRLALILLIVFFSAGVGACIYLKNAPGEEEYMATALAYLEEQKAALYEAERIPIEIDPQTDRVICVHVDHPDTVDKVISWITKAAQVQRVNTIPELAYPHVYVGDKIMGNNEKIYYSEGRKILEFSLSETDSLGFLLFLSGGKGAPMYPEVKEAFTEGVIRQLQNEIVFGDQDVVTFSNGHLEAIDIKTQETAEILFMCIRNCVQITDLTGACLAPMALPIEINGRGCGTFTSFYVTYQETGQFIEISFSPEDSKSFYDYVMALQ